MPRGPKADDAIALTSKRYDELKHIARLLKAPYRQVIRAKVLVACHEHPDWTNHHIARTIGRAYRTVRRWRQRWRRGRSIEDQERAGAPRFFPSSVRAQITALACTLPKAWGKPFSRWSCQALAELAKAKHIVSRISASTIGRWLRADHIKPWQFRSWQKSTDPRFLEKAIPILRLYERAQELASDGHIVVCADEKTSIQARKAVGGTQPARPGRSVLVGDRYQRKGAIQLFTDFWFIRVKRWRVVSIENGSAKNSNRSSTCSSVVSGARRSASCT